MYTSWSTVLNIPTLFPATLHLPVRELVFKGNKRVGLAYLHAWADLTCVDGTPWARKRRYMTCAFVPVWCQYDASDAVAHVPVWRQWDAGTCASVTLALVNHNQLRTMASETVDPIDSSHPPPSCTVPPERLVHCINRLSSGTAGIRSCNPATFSMRGNHTEKNK